MAAVAYLVLMVAVGDTIARAFLRFETALHRLAAAFLVGLLVGTWTTYLAALLGSAATAQPLLPANLVAMGLGLALVGVRTWRQRASLRPPPRPASLRDRLRRVPASTAWDWIVLAVLGAAVTWMALRTLGYRDDRVLLGANEWADIGPTMEIAQSFALGDNFPTTYPLFPGPAILYHFLFYFQVGNLTFLGLDPAAANNVLMIGSLISLLALVMALGRRLFASPAAGRLAAILLFFHGSLAFVPYLLGFQTPVDAWNAILARQRYLPSPLPYRGEDWATWSLNVFLNQRHLASAIAILALALLFVVDRALASDRGRPPSARAGPTTAGGDGRLDAAWRAIRDGWNDAHLRGYVAVGVLLGLLPLWNGPVFVAASALMAVAYVLLPIRVPMTAMGLAAAAVALPQVLYLRQPGIPGTAQFPALHFGYTVDPPTLVNLAGFVAVDFGPKVLLCVVAMVFAQRMQRSVLAAVTAIAVIPFVIQLSVDIVGSHKFLNTWLVLANVFAGWGLVRLWRAGEGLRRGLPGGLRARLRRGVGFAAGASGRLAAVGLAGIIVVGGAIDLMPIKNDGQAAYRLQGDAVFDWVLRETRPNDVFLSDVHIVHPILLAGRPVFFGQPVYAWSAGYDVAPRQQVYSRLLQETSPRALLRLLQANGIAWVAYDDAIRSGRGDLVRNPNEAVFKAHFDVAFTEPEGRYGHLVIYRVPADPGVAEALPDPTPRPTPTPAPVSMQTGGRGTGGGQFNDPRGISIAPNGEVLIADAGNHRIQRFGPDGAFVATYGSRGNGPLQLNEPNGVARDSGGRIFVADTANQRVQEWDASFGYVGDWPGPAPGFYGPRDVAVGPDDALFVLDQGHAQVVRRGADGRVATFGSRGGGAGQMDDPTGLAVAGDRVYVADPAHARIQMFSTAGLFLGSIDVPDWRGPGVRFADVAVRPDGTRIYASSPLTHDVLAFDDRGALVGRIAPPGRDALTAPGSLAFRAPGSLYVVDYELSRVVRIEVPS